MAAEIKERTGHVPTLIEGSRGIFDVKIDGNLVFSKYQTGTFPTVEEILRFLN